MNARRAHDGGSASNISAMVARTSPAAEAALSPRRPRNFTFGDLTTRKTDGATVVARARPAG
jgi:hypothetical protein